jgi:hypothetical protein
VFLFNDAVSCCDCVALVADKWHVSVVHWWIDTDRGKLKCSEENCHGAIFIHHKSYVGWLESKLGDCCERPESRNLSCGMALEKVWLSRGTM